MTTLTWHGRTYTAERLDWTALKMRVTAGGFVAYFSEEKEAVNWLCCYSLRRGKARALVTEALADKNAIVVA